ncbi:MAG: T9SS type A sorting domain-containing protein [Bacteroidia bacterium]
MQVLRPIIAAALIVLLSHVFSSAQRYTLSPGDSLVLKGNMEDMETLSIEQTNTSADTITLKWQKLIANVPAKWEASVCDNMICHTTLADTGTMISLAPGEKGFLLLHITPHVNFGTSTIKYAVWDAEFPDRTDTLTYILNVENASGINEQGFDKNIGFSPVPANKMLNVYTELYSGFAYAVLDISGKLIHSGSVSSNTLTLYTENLPNGIYSIIISDDKKYNIKKIVVQH